MQIFSDGSDADFVAFLTQLAVEARPSDSLFGSGTCAPLVEQLVNAWSYLILDRCRARITFHTFRFGEGCALISMEVSVNWNVHPAKA